MRRRFGRFGATFSDAEIRDQRVGLGANLLVA
jgi:hypothetical protein